jgi:hypothetical protein
MMGDTNITVSLEFSGKSCKSAVKKNIIQSNLMGIIKYVIPLQVYKVVINAENKSWLKQAIFHTTQAWFFVVYRTSTIIYIYNKLIQL